MFGQNKSFGGSSFGSGGGGSLFGGNQNKPSSIFGSNSNQPATGSSLFGNQSKPAGGSLFGSSNTQSASIFGSPQPQSASTSLFGGASNANKSIFGTSNTNTGGGLFGSSTNASATTGSSMFGSSNTSSGGGLFGASASTVSGTTVKFDPPVGSDTMMRNGSSQNISTKHMCITAMKQYENKSMEELRIDDYLANRKTPGAGTTAGGGLFGSTTTQNTGGGLFGSSTTPQKSLFGGSTNTSSPFGASTTTQQSSSLFGSSNTGTQGSSLFGASKPATGGLFGSSNTGTATFGQPSTGGSLFGNTQQQPQQGGVGGGLFGQQQQQPQQQSGGLFGNTSNTGGGLFGSTQTQQPAQSAGFGFGSGTTPNAFGQPAASSTGGLFGSTNTSTTGSSLFGGKPAQSTGFGFGNQPAATTNAFGQPAANTSGGLFGSTANKPGGLFGNTANTNTGGGLFGSQPAAQTGGLFGSTAQPAQQQLTTGFGQNIQPLAVAQPQVAPVPVIGVTADVLQMQANMKLLQSQLTSAPYGDSPLLKYSTEEGKDSPLSTQRQLKFLAAKKCSLGLNTSLQEKSSFISAPVSKVMSDLSPAVKSTDVTRDLNYTSKEAPPTLGKGFRNGSYNPNSSVLANHSMNEGSVVNRTIGNVLDASLNSTSNRLGARGSVKKSNLKQLDLSALADTSRYSVKDNTTNDPDALPMLPQSIITSPETDPHQAAAQRQQNRDKQPPTLNLNTTCDDSTHLEGNNRGTSSVSSTTCLTAPSSVSLIGDENTVVGVKLSKSDYFTQPSILDMKELVKNGEVVIENGLTIGRASYGSVFWPGRISLKNIILDEVVVFRHREVTVYPNEEEKPEEGEELNRPAEVTLERVWYTDKKSKQEIRDVLKLAEIGWRDHLERQTVRMGATFKDYRPETGSWVFRVEHFSKYGLADDDEPMDVAPVAEQQQQQPQQPLQQIDFNTSMTNDIHSQVQRQKIHKNSSEVPVNVILSRVPPAGPLNVTVPQPTVLRGEFRGGLGGGLVDRRSDANFLDSTIEYQMDESEVRIENGEQPEKKPKIEILSDLEYLSSRQLQVATDFKVMPKCVEPKHRFNGGISELKSLGRGKSKLFDLALTIGRNAPVGWSSLGSFVMSAQPESNQILWGTVDRMSDVNEDTLISMCEVNVSSCESCRKGPSSKNDNVTTALTSNFVKYSENYSSMLDKYIEISSMGGYDAHTSVWKLCAALFPANRQDGWSFERGENVGTWLTNESLKHSKKIASKQEPIDAVWQQLCAGNLEKAFDIASEGNLLSLASSLYTSIVSPEATIECFRNQIDNWIENKVLHLVNPTTLKCYLILSGVSHREWTVDGRKYSVNCLDGLHWTEALGIHVWYLRGWKGLDEAYFGYVEDVNAGRAASHRGDLYGELIKLACERDHSVEMVLDCAAGESPHDAFLMWHVWSILHSVGYRTLSKKAETRLHRTYSAQLEEEKLAKYAIFVLQHIDDDDERATAVKKILERIATYTDNDLFDSITEDLDVAKEWIADAQYTVARTVDDCAQLFELAVEAKNLSEVQRLFCDEIAPNAVVCDDLDTLRAASQMIRHLEEDIPEWGAHGRVYVDYCQLMELVKMEEVSDELQEILAVLEDRLHAPIFKTTVQRLALQTIARQLFEYRTETSTVPEWTKLLGYRQMHKMVRDHTSWEDDRFTIEFK